MPSESNIRSNNDDKRRSSNKFSSSLAQDKYVHSLRRDLLLSNFDKTMTVEKARFEPMDEIIPPPTPPPSTITAASQQQQQQQQQQVPAASIITSVSHSTPSPKILDSTHDHLSSVTENELGHSPPTPEMTYTLTMSPSAPTLSSNSSVLSTTSPLTTSHSMSDRRRINPVRSEGNQNSNTSRKKHHNKKQTKPIMHASPAEVFHRNLVDAVSNVEDSDENEHYVYPFSGNESSNHHLSDISTSNMHRPLSVRSTPGSLLYDLKRRQGPGGLAEWLKQAFYLKNSKQQQQLIHTLDEEEDEWSSSEYSRRPKLRNNVKNYESTHQKPDKFSILTRWHDTFVASHDKINTKKSSSKRLFPIQQHNHSQKHPHTYPYGSGIHHSCGYTSDEEDAPLLLRRHKRIPRNKKNCNRNICRNSILFLLSTITILFLFIFYRAQPLMELTVDIGRVLATDKELIFDLKVQAENWNWWTVHVMDADISIFAFSQIVPSSIIFNTTQVKGVDPAEYLGNLVHFDEPLSIQSSAFDKSSKEAISQIRIKSPGADLSGNERWSRMIRYPYGLVVRGVLKYKPIPFTMGIYPISTAICNVTQVDPTTGSVSSDPDKSICTGQEDDEDDLNIFSRFA